MSKAEYENQPGTVYMVGLVWENMCMPDIHGVFREGRFWVDDGPLVKTYLESVPRPVSGRISDTRLL